MSKSKKKKESKLPDEVFVQMHKDYDGESYFVMEQDAENLEEGKVAVYKLHKMGKLTRKLEMED